MYLKQNFYATIVKGILVNKGYKLNPIRIFGLSFLLAQMVRFAPLADAPHFIINNVARRVSRRSRTQFAAVAGSPEVNSRDYIFVGT